MGWLSRLSKGLKKSTEKLSTGITQIFTHKKLDEATLEELEELLISADVGVHASARVVEALRKQKVNKEVTDQEVKAFLASEITKILAPSASEIKIEKAHKPHVVLMVGVNGTGKTTTIGKLSQQWRGQKKKVMIAACDTFRAAAVEQLSVWAKRAGVEMIQGASANADPASVAYQAMEKAKAEKADILVIDTAGRLQNRKDLMEQLTKMVRVIKKLDESAPHHTVLVLDSTTGQNAISQVQIFQELAQVNALIVTKLDGSAKGGIIVSLAEQFKVPIVAIGVGESIDDLQPFDAQSFAERLVGVEHVSEKDA